MLKPIFYSTSTNVPQYPETDKAENAGCISLSSVIQHVKNVVEDVPAFPESRTVSGSVSAAYRLSFEEAFCGLSNENVKRCMVVFLEKKYLHILIPSISVTLT